MFFKYLGKNELFHLNLYFCSIKRLVYENNSLSSVYSGILPFRIDWHYSTRMEPDQLLFFCAV